MEINPLTYNSPNAPANLQRPGDNEKVREAFTDFVGNTFFSQLVTAMRKTVDKPAYFHGGRAETVFQAQMDERMVEAMTKATADTFAGPMYELFALGRPS
jgi:hypothetical protein